MKNKLTDLNNHLFEELERLNDEELTGDKLSQEIKRAKAITGVASQIIEMHNTAIEAQKVISEYSGDTDMKLLIDLK